MTKPLAVVLAFCLASLLPLGVRAWQADSLEVNLSTPYHTVSTHLLYLQEAHYHTELAAQVFHPDDATPAEAQKLAIMLKQVFDGQGLFIEVDEIPNTPDYIDSTLNRLVKQRFTVVADLPDVYLTKKNGQWYYSRYTVQRLPGLHEETYPFYTDQLLNLLPRIGHKQVMGMPMWQLVGILLVTLISFIIYRVFKYVSRRLIVQVLTKFGYTNVAQKYVVPVAQPFGVLVVVLYLSLMVPVLQLPIRVSQYLILLLHGLGPLFLTFVVYRFIDLLAAYMQKLAGRTETSLDDQMVPLIRKALKTFVVIIGGLWVLSNLNVPILPLLTGLSIGGLAVALAAQETIKNFFGSLMIFIDRPFQVGDWVTTKEFDGTIEEVGFRSTRIRTFRDSVTSIPNGKLADLTIDNHGMRTYRRFYTRLAIAYDTPTEHIKLFTEGLDGIVKNTRMPAMKITIFT